MAFHMVLMVAAMLGAHACVCKWINIHVGVVKTGLPKDQTFLTVQGSMGSLVARQQHHKKEAGKAGGECNRSPDLLQDLKNQ